VKRLIVAAAMVVCVPLSAQADHMVYTYYDMIRPGGHKRPDTIGNANVATCNAQVGVQTGRVSDAYTACMRGLGYRLTSEYMQHDGKRQTRRHVSHPGPSHPAASQNAAPSEIGSSHMVQ
jgi:hypothetical protein